jgi:hypothetical protein
MPPGFIVLTRSQQGVTCTTSELNALNARLQSASTDCLVLTAQVRRSPPPPPPPPGRGLELH